MPTLLTDFSVKELLFLRFILDDKAKDFRQSIEMASSFSDGPTKDELLKFYRGQLDMTEQWITKVFEAHMEVNKLEIIRSN